MSINDKLMMRNGRTQAQNLEFGALALSESGWINVIRWLAEPGVKVDDLWRVVSLGLSGVWRRHRTWQNGVQRLTASLRTPLDTTDRNMAELNRRARVLDALVRRGVLGHSGCFVKHHEQHGRLIDDLIGIPIQHYKDQQEGRL